jgi:UDP-N-acetylglucosamine--N-acetylmuramyl-(pentapeptide) pyrophosphoryl-undecaprenol N-acetylglucosamine transferase
MKILFAGGGTAGHVNPALAVAQAFQKRHPESEIRFVGTRGGIEASLVPKAGFPVDFIEVEGFRRKLSLANFRTLIHLFTSMRESKALLKTHAPDLVVGTGGYVSYPVLLTAAKMRIPTLIHEQNAIPGATTRLLSGKVDRTLISFEESRARLPKSASAVLTGNPIRGDFASLSKEDARRQLGIPPESLFILSFGGSMGARKINEELVAFILLHSEKENWRHTHATGKFGWRWVPRLLDDSHYDAKAHPEIRVIEYIHDMPAQMAACDLVICRAGAITLAELGASGKPAILIPSPHVANNHQYHNAKAMENKGAAIVVEEKNLSGEGLHRCVSDLFANPQRLSDMSRNQRIAYLPHAGERICDNMEELMEAGSDEKQK